MKRYRLGLVCFLVLFLFGCEERTRENTNPESTVVSGITRILMHETNSFTFLVERADTHKVGQLRIYASKTTLFSDLKEDEPIRVEYRCRSSSRNEYYQCKSIPADFSIWSTHPAELTIHLHSTKEVDGGGWNHGKFGQGSTTVIQ
ncbi:MAG: hypothetical protein Q8Q89_02245 [bacterium]|nr:hypothetical protein [bacterium]